MQLVLIFFNNILHIEAMYLRTCTMAETIIFIKLFKLATIRSQVGQRKQNLFKVSIYIDVIPIGLYIYGIYNTL